MDPQLTFFSPSAQSSASNVRWLEDLLRDRKTWLTAAQILQLASLEATDTAKRKLRELANASARIISGQRGYKHLEHATPEETHHCCAWLESQAKAMATRACALRRNAHQIFG